MAGEIRIGTSGYHYDDWRGRFYPADLPKARWLAYYADHFDTVEINASFYRLPTRETFSAWAEQAPDGFVYAVKFSRFGSHQKKLLDPEATIGRFLERAEALGPTLGPVLVQLPPRFHENAERLDAFLAAAPKRHRWAVELRDASWLSAPVYRLLERHGAALVIHDLLAHPRVVTADFVYLRFHGHDYGGRYTPQALGAAARRIADHVAAGLDVYAYFNNDRAAAAITDAQNLRRYLGAALSSRSRRGARRGRGGAWDKRRGGAARGASSPRWG